MPYLPTYHKCIIVLVLEIQFPNTSPLIIWLQGPLLINRIVDSWDLNCAVWERHLELVNIEDSPTQINYGYKVVFYPTSKAKRYIQVIEK